MQPGTVRQSVSRLVIQDEVILRVPVAAASAAPASSNGSSARARIASRSRAIRRALLSGPEQVDFILANRARVRAEFDEDCPALDFYGGFYLQPDDDRICAGRDAVHSRMGGSCTIDRFKQLVPKLSPIGLESVASRPHIP